MTVCIAALCEGGNSCVLAADRMAIYGYGEPFSVGRDDETRKIHALKGNSVLMHSGFRFDTDEIVAKMESDKQDDARERLIGVLEELLKKKRDDLIGRLIGGGLDYSRLTQIVSNAPSGPFFDVWKRANELPFGKALLVAPSRKGLAIHRVVSFTVEPAMPLGYAAVGSGEDHASTSLDIHRYDTASSIEQSLLLVYTAKKAAELAPGVGSATDMAILTQDGFTDVSKKVVDLLESLWKQRLRPLTNEQAHEINASLSHG